MSITKLKSKKEFPQLPKGAHRNSLLATSILNNYHVIHPSGSEQEEASTLATLVSPRQQALKTKGGWASKLGVKRDKCLHLNIIIIYVEKQTPHRL